MKKVFGLVDGFKRSTQSGGSSSSNSTPKAETPGIEETVLSEHFQIAKTVRHGFPYQPTALAYDPVQNLVAIGTKSGSIRIFGQPGVDCHVRHESECAVIQLLFLVNEGALISVCADDQLHLWTLRQKKPEIVHSLKFQKERITSCHLPFQSKWMYIGTERGNIWVVNIESFALSGYTIMWNKAIELLRKTHPGPVVHLSDNQNEPNKGLRSISWHHEGKQFVCSHTDGSLTYWNTRSPQRPANTVMPHSKLGRDGKPEPCRAILKVDLRTAHSGEPFVIFSGGMPYEKSGHTPTVTIMRGSSTTVLEMEHSVIDFVTICSTPWNSDFQDPIAVIVLLQHDFVVVDLLTPGYPCFENPYQMDLHESPVTACLYFADCPPDLIPAFYSVGCRQKKTGYSDKEWPIKGGEWGSAACSYSEIIITGHADGSVKFWDSPVATLQILYKLKTAKLFDTSKCRAGADTLEYPFAVQLMHFCVESRLLCVAGCGYVVLFRFSKLENSIECPVLEINVVLDSCNGGPDSPDWDYSTYRTKQSVNSASAVPADKVENEVCVRPKAGPCKWLPGYQPDLCCLLTTTDGDTAPAITTLCVNSVFGLLAVGTECGLVVVDIVQNCVVLNVASSDLYGSVESYCQASRSRTNMDGFCQASTTEDFRASYSDQLFEETSDVVSVPSPTAGGCLMQQQQQQTTTTTTYSTGPASQPPPQNKPSELQAIQELGQDSGTEDTMSVESRGGDDDEGGGDDDDDDDEDDAEQGSQLSESGNQTVLGPQAPPRRSRKSAPAVDRITSIDFLSEGSDQSSENTLSGSSSGRRVAVVKASSASVRRSSAPQHAHGGPIPERKSLHLPPPQSMSENSISDVCRSVSVPLQKTPLRITKSDAAERAVIEDSDVMQPPRSPASKARNNSAHDFGDGFDSAVPTTPSIGTNKPGEGMRLIAKMNKKFHSYLRMTSKSAPVADSAAAAAATSDAKKRPNAQKIQVIDLSSEDVQGSPTVQKLTYSELSLQADKSDGSFCRSQSSSASSLDNVGGREAIQCLSFTETFARKSDLYTCPCLWVGTSVGSFVVVTLAFPAAEQRNSEAVSLASSGTVFRLKGAVLLASFLDCNGKLIPPIDSTWKENIRPEEPPVSEEKKERKPYSRQSSTANMKTRVSPSGEVPLDKHYAVMCSEKQARVVSLPSQSSVFKVKITETSAVAKADVITVRDSLCLACFLLNGHIMTFSLPSLKPLFDEDYLPSPDVRVVRTFSLSNNCHALYFCSPTELQKLSLSSEACDNLNEMLGELFLPRDMPEAPKQGFFKNLFGIGSSTLDREELFGETTSGKPPRNFAVITSGIGQAQNSANLAKSEIGRALKGAIERGERLGELDEKTEQMRNEAEEFSRMASQLKMKYRDKKWYQF